VIKGNAASPLDLDGRSVPIITAYLFHAGGHDNPAVLLANAEKCFQGSILLGLGFTFDDTNTKGHANSLAEMGRLVKKDPRNADRIFPYIGGEEVNDSPTHEYHRYAIDFFDRSLEEAESWPDLIEIVRERVKPERDGQKRDALRERWWQYAEKRPGLYRTIHSLRRVIVRSLTSKFHESFTLLDNSKPRIFDQTLIVFTFDNLRTFALLASRPHEAWALFFGATLEDRPRYNVADCFETFPFPENFDTLASLERAGSDYYEFRASSMQRNKQGLTATYNRFHDPDERDPEVLRMRALHMAMDRAVLDAYGWTDIQPVCEFLLDYEDEEDGTIMRKRKKPWRYRWPDEIRDEVLARLLELNRQRASQEDVAGGVDSRLGRTNAPTRKTNRLKAAVEVPLVPGLLDREKQ